MMIHIKPEVLDTTERMNFVQDRKKVPRWTGKKLQIRKSDIAQFRWGERLKGSSQTSLNPEIFNSAMPRQKWSKDVGGTANINLEHAEAG